MMAILDDERVKELDGEARGERHAEHHTQRQRKVRMRICHWLVDSELHADANEHDRKRLEATVQQSSHGSQ